MAKQSSIYLDHAAATPVDARVARAMSPYLSDDFYNPSAVYMAAGGTEANNLAVQGVMRHRVERRDIVRRNIVRRSAPYNVVVSSVEHESVSGPARLYDCREVGVRTDGRLDADDLRRKIDGDTILVSIAYANNEIGTVQSMREISRIIAEKRAERGASGLPLLLHADACQAANYLDLHAPRLGVDLMTLNGGKIYGPKQSGVLYVKAGTILEPLILGGGQERGMRSGTENVAAAAGFGEALRIAQTMRPKEAARLRKLQTEFIDRLRKSVPETVVNGSLKYRLPNNVHVTFPGRDNERLLIQLDEAGIMAAAGSACGADKGEPSHVLRAIGLSDADARSSLRFTMGRSTTAPMVARTVRTLAGLLSP